MKIRPALLRLVLRALRWTPAVRTSLIRRVTGRLLRHTAIPEVAEIIERNRLRCLIGGSFAFAATSGRFPSNPGDIDIMFADSERDSVTSAFRESGFEVIPLTHYMDRATKDGWMQIDLFRWRDAGPNLV